MGAGEADGGRRDWWGQARLVGVAVFSTVPSVRDHPGRGRDGNAPSVERQDGDGAVRPS